MRRVAILSFAVLAACGSTPPSQPQAPSTPTGLSATVNGQSVTLTWNASDGATAYTVSRATAPSGPFTDIASPIATTYNDGNLAASTTYYYEVAATRGKLSSAP